MRYLASFFVLSHQSFFSLKVSQTFIDLRCLVFGEEPLLFILVLHHLLSIASLALVMLLREHLLGVKVHCLRGQTTRLDTSLLHLMSVVVQDLRSLLLVAALLAQGDIFGRMARECMHGVPVLGLWVALLDSLYALADFQHSILFSLSADCGPSLCSGWDSP